MRRAGSTSPVRHLGLPWWHPEDPLFQFAFIAQGQKSRHFWNFRRSRRLSGSADPFPIRAGSVSGFMSDLTYSEVSPQIRRTTVAAGRGLASSEYSGVYASMDLSAFDKSKYPHYRKLPSCNDHNLLEIPYPEHTKPPNPAASRLELSENLAVSLDSMNCKTVYLKTPWEAT